MARWKEDVTGDVPEAKELKEIRGKCVKQREKQTLNQSVPNTSISCHNRGEGRAPEDAAVVASGITQMRPKTFTMAL